jgi:EAL domain-containing protein (putative c-di-GMP-specific phosphodiesterase class I)
MHCRRLFGLALIVPDDALAIVNSDRGFEFMQRIRETVAAMRIQGQKDLQSAVANANSLRLASQIGLAIAIAIAGGLAALTIRDTRRTIAELLIANQQLELEIAERKLATGQVREGAADYALGA